MSPSARAEAERAMRERDLAEGAATGDLRRDIFAGMFVNFLTPHEIYTASERKKRSQQDVVVWPRE